MRALLIVTVVLTLQVPGLAQTPLEEQLTLLVGSVTRLAEVEGIVDDWLAEIQTGGDTR